MDEAKISKIEEMLNVDLPITEVVKQGPDQVKNFPPISVLNVKGQLVARDGNSRLHVALETNAEKKIKVRIEKEIESFRDLAKRQKCFVAILNGLSLSHRKRVNTAQ